MHDIEADDAQATINATVREDRRMTDGCAALGCREDPELVIALRDDRTRTVCRGHARQEVAEQDAEVLHHV